MKVFFKEGSYWVIHPSPDRSISPHLQSIIDEKSLDWERAIMLVEIHGGLANTALYYTIAMAVWGLYRYFRRQGVDSSYWAALVIAEIRYLAQGALGAILFFSGIGHLAGPFMHILYGVVAIISIPAVYAFTKGGDQRRDMLVLHAAGS